jgi:hypothetical protein
MRNKLSSTILYAILIFVLIPLSILIMLSVLFFGIAIVFNSNNESTSQGVSCYNLPRPSEFGPWQEVGRGSASCRGISNTPTDSSNPSLAIALDGTLYVAWQGTWIYVLEWNGSLWTDVGPGSASNLGIVSPMQRIPHSSPLLPMALPTSPGKIPGTDILIASRTLKFMSAVISNK